MSSFKLLLGCWKHVIHIPAGEAWPIPLKLLEGKEAVGDKSDPKEPWALKFEEHEYYKVKVRYADRKADKKYKKVYAKKEMKISQIKEEGLLKDEKQMKEYGADVYIMMNSGADPNRKNKDGTTPLGCSIRNWQNNRHHI